MAKTDPQRFDFDTKMLDVFTESVTRLLEAWEKDAISAEKALLGINDLVILANKVPRSVTVTVGENNGE